jgi:sugar phosphate isomerase/epimerase
MNRRLFVPVLICGWVTAQTPPLPLPNHPIGRCVRVLGVTAPEDARTAGFEYVELALQDLLPLPDAEFARIVERIHKLGLPAISGYGFMPADVMIVGPSVDWAKVDEALRHGIGRAKQLGLSMVVYGNLLNRARRAPEGFSIAEARKQLQEFGKRAAREGKKNGLTVLFEPMPPASTNTINTVAEGLALVEAVNDPHFQLLIDFGYVTQSKEDLKILHRAAKHIRQVEIQNPNGRVYPKAAEEADYASFFRALKQGGYRGGFSIHGAPTDFFVDAPRAIAMLRGVAGPALR